MPNFDTRNSSLDSSISDVAGSRIGYSPISDSDWDLVIKPHSAWWDLQLDEVWRYRDLLWMFVKRDFVSVYKQTILGPLWFFIQPLLTTIVFVIIFSGVANISTDGLPPLLFYLGGTIPWNYFSSCLNKTSTTFISNAHIFGKVYFPRLIMPLSVVVSNLIQFAIQFVLFGVVLIWYWATGVAIQPNILKIIGLLPIVVVIMAALGLGVGILVSALTTKYRDFTFLISFGVQLGMYATPIIYPVSAVPEKWRWLIQLNPMSAPIETFRAAFLGGAIPLSELVISGIVTGVLLLLGMFVFSKVEKVFMDTV